ncbi:MAG: hypothetical protein Tsb002_18480 [Wenzhouxiangellaceae bacterium]
MRLHQVALLLFILLPSLSWADITGQVIRSDNLDPIANVEIRVQADPASPVVLTGADGRFTLPVNPPASVTVTATVPYDPNAAENYPTEQTIAFNNDDILLQLEQLPAADNPTYQPPTVSGGCVVCHQDQVDQWQTSNHAHAAVNEWVLDLYSGTGTPGGNAGYVYLDSHDPGESGFCAVCHAPLADVFDPGNVQLNQVAQAGALDGVQCLACHQVHEVNNNVSALHHLGNAEYRFPDQPITQFFVWGPLADVGFPTMNALATPLFEQSLFCASCHEYINPDTGAPGQSTYTEWLAGPWSQPGPNFRTCQNCHMPQADEPGTISSLGGSPVRPAEQRHSHEFIGASPQRLDDAIDMTLDAFLENGELVVRAEVANVGAGHSFPTGVSVRNAILQINASVAGQNLTQSAGPVIPFWGDDNVPGQQPGDLAGLPGTGYARVLEGRINGQGPTVRPVLFIDAEAVFSDTRIASGDSDLTEVRFDLASAPPGPINVSAEVLYRRAWRATVVTKGWTETPAGGPIEISITRAERQLLGGAPVAVPTLNRWALWLMIGVLLLVAAGNRWGQRQVS